MGVRDGTAGVPGVNSKLLEE